MTEDGQISNSDETPIPFEFCDEIFPSIDSPFPSLALSPDQKIQKFIRDYHIVSKVDNNSENIHRLFRWAREVLDFAEAQPGLNKKLIDTAIDVVKLISDSSNDSTAVSNSNSKFHGAANYTVGLWYLFGLFDYPMNADLAMEKFLVAAKQGYSRALYRLGAFYESSGQIVPALAYFEHGIKRKDASCYYRMSIAYLQGQLKKPIDAKLGLEYLEKASFLADPDCAQAAYIYGLVQLGELNIPSLSEYKQLDREAGILALERSAWLGFGPALLRMGKAWQGGEKGYDPSIALRYFHIASRQDQFTVYREKLKRDKDDKSPIVGPLLGVPEMEISKWMICGCEGKFPINEEWAFKFALMAANQGNSTGEFAIGYYYEVGVYVESNVEEALKYYKLAADHGFEDAKVRLPILLKEIERAKDKQPNESIPDDGVSMNAGIQRQLTRKDHERTISMKRQTSKISRSNTRLLPNLPKDISEPKDKPLPSPPLLPKPAYNSPPVSRSPSPRRVYHSLTGNTISAPTPLPKDVARPFNFTSSSMEVLTQPSFPASRSPSPRRSHRYSASVVTEQSFSGNLESRINPRKVSSPVRAPILEDINTEIAGPNSISRTPSPPKPVHTKSMSIERTPSPPKLAHSMSMPMERTQSPTKPNRISMERTPSPTKPTRISSYEQLNIIRNPIPSPPSERPSFSTANSAPPLRTVSEQGSTFQPANDEPIDNQVLYKIVPLKVKKSSELLKRHSFINEQYDSNRTISPEPKSTSPDPIKRRSTKLSPVSSPGIGDTSMTSLNSTPGPIQNSPSLRHPDVRTNIRSYSSQPTLGDYRSDSDISNTSTPTKPSSPLNLEKFNELQLDESPTGSIKSNQSITPIKNRNTMPERSTSKSPVSKEKSRPSLTRPFSFFTSKSKSKSPPKTPPQLPPSQPSPPPPPPASTESLTPPLSQFSRTSTVSSSTTTTSNASSISALPPSIPETTTTTSSSSSSPSSTTPPSNPPPPRVALTFDEMGIPLGTEEEKDCIIM